MQSRSSFLKRDSQGEVYYDELRGLVGGDRGTSDYPTTFVSGVEAVGYGPLDELGDLMCGQIWRFTPAQSFDTL